MRKLIIILMILSSSVMAEERIKVNVGMYPFAPFVETRIDRNNEQQPSGMTIDLISALNQSQNTYYFEAIQIPPKRRYQFYKDGHYDVIFYENKEWGWDGIDIDESNSYQKGGEVYVALNKPGRGQEYFEDFTGKRMMGILGFHYGFSGFNASENYLMKHYYMHFSYDNLKNITLLLKERGDIAVITKAYLQRYLTNHPEHKSKLLISEKMDQEYQHAVLVRPDIHPSVDEINSMLETLYRSEILEELWKKYGIESSK
jgi:polar amino acid transport system substrate-binding protein